MVRPLEAAISKERGIIKPEFPRRYWLKYSINGKGVWLIILKYPHLVDASTKAMAEIKLPIAHLLENLN